MRQQGHLTDTDKGILVLGGLSFLLTLYRWLLWLGRRIESPKGGSLGEMLRESLLGERRNGRSDLESPLQPEPEPEPEPGISPASPGRERQGPGAALGGSE